MEAIILKHKSIIQKFLLQNLDVLINHYKNSYMPELSETTGRHQSEHIRDFEKKKESLLIDIKDGSKLSVSKTEVLNALRIEVNELYSVAQDFPNNPWIKIGNLRKCIALINDLKSIEPQLEIYSNRWIALRTKISL